MSLKLSEIKKAPEFLGLSQSGLMMEIYGKPDKSLWQKWATGMRPMPLMPQMILSYMLAGLPKFTINLESDSDQTFWVSHNRYPLITWKVTDADDEDLNIQQFAATLVPDHLSIEDYDRLTVLANQELLNFYAHDTP